MKAKLFHTFLILMLCPTLHTHSSAPQQTNSGLFSWIMLPIIGTGIGCSIAWKFFWKNHPDTVKHFEIDKTLKDVADHIQQVRSEPLNAPGNKNKNRRKRIKATREKNMKKIVDQTQQAIKEKFNTMTLRDTDYEENFIEDELLPKEKQKRFEQIGLQELSFNVPRLAFGGTAGLISGLLMANYLNKK